MANETKIKDLHKVVGSIEGTDVSQVIGSTGLIWKVTDTLTGELLGIRDVSGFPCFIVDSDGRATVGNGTIHSSSAFSVFNTTQGSVPAPRMTQAQRLAIATPIAGLLVYQTDGVEGLYQNTSTGWKIVTPVTGAVLKTRKDITGTSYTIISDDKDKILYTTNTSPVTITIPAGLTTNQEYEVIQYAAGQVSFVSSGTTLKYLSYELPSILELNGRVTISYIDTETYQIIGDLTMI